MLIVKKFGGTSVANKERIYNVANKNTKKVMTWWLYFLQWENTLMS